MESNEAIENNTHHGHAMKRIRKALGMKQEVMAEKLGVGQASVSRLEQQREIDSETLEKIAKALDISVNVLREMQEDPVTIIIENNTFESGSNNIGTGSDNENIVNYNNPIEEILKLTQEKQELYERLLALEKERSQMLEKMLNEQEGKK
ncbi:helix-turn-helix domain-containing protein [Dysgonomonas sp. 511]|uniref:helix-turn-helix domain-containing protein n=1 Tax=Dysgonomonas sp. 511 TaxID=2302930 RepID=UPI0013CF5D58|nr:helix-turn-helix transcriptional regulator [Dysgonomonas sp. 511]NDV78682.1 XRE family transcriptional regulator [Dysgonomonas sp. 511]